MQPYIQAMVYHDRERSEHEALGDLILASLRTDEHRREVREMRQTMADVLREEGLEQGREQGLEQGRKEGTVQTLRRTLLQQLRTRFTRVPRAVERTIGATEDVDLLNTWLLRFAQATTLDDVGIQPQR